MEAQPEHSIVEVDGYSLEEEESRWSKQSIYKIPDNIIVASNVKANYYPQVVSIGPYHHGAPSLQAMEKHKLRALHRFCRPPGTTPDSLCQKLRPLVEELKAAYDQLDEAWQKDDDKFLGMMVKDGCLILELLYKSEQILYEPEKKRQCRSAAQAQEATTVNYAYPENDPIFSKHGWLNIVPYLKRDMLMLENQIPMSVLRTLDLLKNPSAPQKPEKLIERILRFFCPSSSPNQTGKFINCWHILDLYRETLIVEPETTEKCSIRLPKCCEARAAKDEIIRSATELNDAGISIKVSKSHSLRDISFTQGICGAQLNLPRITLDDTFESLYLNLIAYERFHVKTGQDNAVTSYLLLMDGIIDSVQDVALLHSSGVIQNALSSDKAVAKLFNSLTTDTTLDPNSKLGQVHGKVSHFCRKKVPKWRAYCCHNYCSNPLVAVTVVAAILIFTMTVLQTGYIVYDHLKKSPKSP